ncbi:MAG TPA: RcpC/CpaB family pilus assembly protein, partial [Sphingomicrobium sp.]|nr:RcpC/CpaB family pilus assembly protein [Sphingomicrobium sp.]
ETIVRNIRVLATDQRFTDKDPDGKTVIRTFSNVTLEVTPKIAEKIAVAQSLGSLSMSLRSIADNSSDLERAVATGAIKVPAGTSPAQERQMLLAYSDRPIDNNTTFTTGGEVSRFQRTTVPGKPTGSGEQAPAANNANAVAVPVGPVVRIARGNSVTVVPVGAR